MTLKELKLNSQSPEDSFRVITRTSLKNRRRTKKSKKKIKKMQELSQSKRKRQLPKKYTLTVESNPITIKTKEKNTKITSARASQLAYTTAMLHSRSISS